MRTKLYACLLACTAVFATTNPPAQQPEEDLFKKDTPVFSFHGSFLFWRLQESGLDYAIKMQHSSPGGTVFAQGKVHNATWNGEPGFRVAASYFRAPHYWELWLQYTRLTARGSNHVAQPTTADRFLLSTWGESLFAGPLAEASSHLHFNYNVGDFFADRVFIPNPHLRLRLLGGGSTAWMSQNWIVHYTNTSNVLSYLRNHWKYVGGGLRIGTTVDWYCGWDLYLTAVATAATYLGSYKNESYQTVDLAGSPIRDMRYSDIRPTFTVQGSLGLSWQKNFPSTRMEIFGGYEINSWWNLQEMYRSTAAASNANKINIVQSSLLALQGLTARVTLDF